MGYVHPSRPEPWLEHLGGRCACSNSCFRNRVEESAPHQEPDASRRSTVTGTAASEGCWDPSPGRAIRINEFRQSGSPETGGARPFGRSGHGSRSLVLGEPSPAPRLARPEDMSGEMMGRTFRLSARFSSGPVQLAPGATVVVVAWSNSAPAVRVRTPALSPFDVPKALLRPVARAVPGLSPYGANLGRVVADFVRGAQAIATRQSQYRTPAAQVRFRRELARLRTLQARRERLLNRRLIQETMFNRFDPIIRVWTDHYNQQFGLSRAAALDPNLVKSMLFQESQLGTAGLHLEIRPSHPAKTRFNLGQVIDSSASALLIMMREMAPALLTTPALQNIATDLASAQQELRSLRAIRSPTSAQRARLAPADAAGQGELGRLPVGIPRSRSGDRVQRRGAKLLLKRSGRRTTT
jgi:hypothetical protein